MTQLRLASIAPGGSLENDAWLTPPEVAKRIALWAGITSSDKVLEPSAGLGALAKAARELRAEVFCCELDPEFAKQLEADGLDVRQGDFLEANLSCDYTLALLNPPYSDGQTEAHILHALRFAPRAVCIAQLGVLAGQERKRILWGLHTLKRLVVFSTRPKFSGAPKTAMRDFCVLEVVRGRQDIGATGVSWW